MKFILLGRGGLLTSIILQEISARGFLPEFVIIETTENNKYPNLTKILCEKLNIKHVLVRDPNSDECIQSIKSFDIDFILVASLGTVLTKEILTQYTIYNVHMGVLPNFRGAFTNFWKIKNGDDTFGVTIHKMEEKIDSGVVILINERDFSDIINGYQFFRLNYKLAAETVIDFFELINTNSIDKNRQIAEEINTTGQYYRKFREEDFEINLENSCLLNYKFINRAQYYLSPYFIFENRRHYVKNANLLHYYPLGEKSMDVRLEFVDEKTVILYNYSGILEMKL